MLFSLVYEKKHEYGEYGQIWEVLLVMSYFYFSILWSMSLVGSRHGALCLLGLYDS